MLLYATKNWPCFQAFHKISLSIYSNDRSLKIFPSATPFLGLHICRSIHTMSSSNFISLFSHIYFTTYNISYSKIIFNIFYTETSTNHLVQSTNIANARYLKYCTVLVSTEEHEVIGMCCHKNHEFHLNSTHISLGFSRKVKLKAKAVLLESGFYMSSMMVFVLAQCELIFSKCC